MNKKLKKGIVILVLAVCVYFLFVHPFIDLGHLAFFKLKQLIFWLILAVMTPIVMFKVVAKKWNRIISGLFLVLVLALYFPLQNNIYKKMLWEERTERVLVNT